MKITINGEKKDILPGLTLLQLLQDLKLKPAMIAVEKNEAIIPCKDYETTEIFEGDILELIRFMGGGA